MILNGTSQPLPFSVNLSCGHAGRLQNLPKVAETNRPIGVTNERYEGSAGIIAEVLDKYVPAHRHPIAIGR